MMQGSRLSRTLTKMSVFNYSKPQPIALASRARKTRTFTDPNGLVRKEFLPEVALWERFVTPAGSVVMLPLATGRTIRQRNESPYYYQIRGEKIAKGWAPLGECPVAKGYLALDGRACKGAHSDADPCRHVLGLIETRTEEHNKRQAEVAERWKPQSQRTLDLMAKIMTAQGQAPDIAQT